MKISDKISAPIFDVIVIIIGLFLGWAVACGISRLYYPIALPVGLAIIFYIIYIVYSECNYFNKDNEEYKKR